MTLILSPKLFKEATHSFYEILESGDFSYPTQLIPFEFEVDSNAFLWALCEESYTQELISEVNIFIHELCKLQILERVIKGYGHQEQIVLSHELTRVPLYFCLRQPNEFRNRIIYLTTHLCHHAHLGMGGNYDDDLPDDRKIGYKTLQMLAKPWKSSVRLMSALDSVGNRSEEFRDVTDDYRDKASHRQPPSLETGLKTSVKRLRGDKLAAEDPYFQGLLKTRGEDIPKFVYAPHTAKPLKTSEMLPVLGKQASCMKEAFHAYWELVLEQASALSS